MTQMSRKDLSQNRPRIACTAADRPGNQQAAIVTPSMPRSAAISRFERAAPLDWTGHYKPVHLRSGGSLFFKEVGTEYPNRPEAAIADAILHECSFVRW